MLIPFPFAYLFGSAVVDAWGRLTGRRTVFRTARHLNAMGLATAAAAAVPGMVDYAFAVPPDSSAKARATDHLLANLSALALFAAARAGRGAEDATPPAWVVALELCGAGMLTIGGWMGGTLVTRNQISVDHRYADAGKWKLDVHAPDEAAAGADIDAGAADALGVDQMKLVRVGSRRIVLARTEAGYVAFDDRCTHKGGPLSDGTLACGVVQCPWHGSQFDVRTGAVRHGPARQSVATYAVEERGGRVWVRLPASEPAA